MNEEFVVSRFVNDDQLREAEAVFRRITGLPRSLSSYVEYAIANHRELAEQKTLAEALTEYVAKKTKEHDLTLLSMRQLRSINHELGTIKKHFPTGPVSQFTAAISRSISSAVRPSLKTYNNRRCVLSTFFKFAFQNDWIVANPIEKTLHHRIQHRRGSAITNYSETCRRIDGVRLRPERLLLLHNGPRKRRPREY